MTPESPSYDPRIDGLLNSLRKIDEQLEFASGDFDETIKLREHQRELRAVAAKLGQQARTPAEIARQLDHLRRLRHELLSGHVSVGHVGGGNGPGGGGIEPRDVFAMNEAIDEAWGRADLERQIEKLEAELERTGGSMSHPELGSRLISRLPALLWLVAIPILAVAAFLWLDRPPGVVTAEVVESSVESTATGLVGNVTWVDDDGIRRVRSVELTSEHVTAGYVELTVDAGGEARVLDPARGPSATVLLVVALIGLAFAAVVVATVRGFGYVRGTGSYGEMDPDDVKESHAFYWRD